MAMFSRRSHSYGEIKEVNCGSTLQVLALENEVCKMCIYYVYFLCTCMYMTVSVSCVIM